MGSFGTACRACAVALALLPTASLAQTADPAAPSAPSPPVIAVPPVDVIGTTPLGGTGIERDKVPANVQTITSSGLTREGTASLVGGLADQAGSVNVNATLVDPFQPDILYRGFEASPVLGTPQGIAVYQNGVRVNEAFGDTVNWDLIPDIAVDRIDMVSANPVYGLNALGGAAVVTMKNGFTFQGFNSELGLGSYGAHNESFEYGKRIGVFGAYIAGRSFDEGGWRDFSPDHLRQLYADIGARTERATLAINFTGATNRLFGEGTTPVQELAVDRALDFTTPQSNFNQVTLVTISGSYDLTDALSVQANVYRREFLQNVVNGNTTDFTACVPANGFLCQSDGTTPALGPTGAPIPDISQSGAVPIGENDFETIHTVTYGSTAQTNYTGNVAGHSNNLVLGGSIDRSLTGFQSSTEVGVINSSLQVLPSGFFVDTPENSGFNATPVSLTASNNYYGLFVTDTFDVTSAIAVTASGRYNIAEIGLVDRLGSNLTGNNRYAHFNPALGATYKIVTGLTAYAGYAEGNRAPTPSEIECSNPAEPCLLPSSLSSDPPTLKQVISHTYEAGLRGNFTLPETVPGRFNWNAGLFRTDLDDDIYGIATSLSSGFFENIGSTRRQGIETGIRYKDEKWSIYLDYSLVDATFQSPLTLASPSNPFADASGNINVRPGDRLPGIPEHQIKLGVDYRIVPKWTVGGVLTYFSDQYLRGDESNQNAPLPGYAVLSLHSSYEITENFEVFGNVQNALDSRYATFAQFGDPTGVGAPGVPAGAVTNGPGVDNRFLAPAAPIAVFGGIRVTF
ncbi:MAG TPA: TonB-dependent receptor [Candidatus Sulfotelmatobacter sp.]|nr:TonB-dependent receptor [Candidatus Sulfotelmatobacter sp.]